MKKFKVGDQVRVKLPASFNPRTDSLGIMGRLEEYTRLGTVGTVVAVNEYAGDRQGRYSCQVHFDWIDRDGKFNRDGYPDAWRVYNTNLCLRYSISFRIKRVQPGVL